MADLLVAKTILEQLGGRKFTVMTGAKNFVGSENALSFRLPGGGGFTKRGINAVRIALNGGDTYDVTFSRVRAGKVTVLTTLEDIYADQLREVFTRETGLAVGLGARFDHLATMKIGN